MTENENYQVEILSNYSDCGVNKPGLKQWGFGWCKKDRISKKTRTKDNILKDNKGLYDFWKSLMSLRYYNLCVNYSEFKV